MSERDTIVFDGDCGICTWTIEWVNRLDRKKRFGCVSFHEVDLSSLSPNLTREQCEREMVVVTRAGTIVAGGDAVRYISRRLPLMRLVWPLMAAPGLRALVDRLYVWVAGNRHRISRLVGRQSCKRE